MKRLGDKKKRPKPLKFTVIDKQQFKITNKSTIFKLSELPVTGQL